MAPRPDLTELGTTGLRRSSGYVYEEFLTQLRGRLGAKTYREMADNDPVIGSFLYAIEKIITRLDWRVDPYSEMGSTEEPAEQDVEVARFVEECLNDMNDSWDSTLASILSFIVFGWSWHEIVYKVRQGPDQKDPRKRSKFNDGKVGWRKWPIRAQETWMRWVFDEDGGIQAYVQYDPSGGGGRGNYATSTTQAGAGGTSGQGSSGGTGGRDTGIGSSFGGGGGGASGAGQSSPNRGGGTGSTWSVDSVTYAVGGDGGRSRISNSGVGASASANTGRGGGGGGAPSTASANNGGGGGSGIVKMRIPDAYVASFSAGVTSSGGSPSGGFRVYTVTAAGASDTVTFTAA